MSTNVEVLGPGVVSAVDHGSDGCSKTQGEYADVDKVMGGADARSARVIRILLLALAVGQDKGVVSSWILSCRPVDIVAPSALPRSCQSKPVR